MTYDLLGALATFALVSSITPGPNNLMLLASGANFGIGRTVPHMLGISIGFTVMVALVGIGLMQVFDAFPVVYTVLKVASAAYLLHLAWKIATASSAGAKAATGKPFTFVQAAAFQWVNPKAWSMALTSITVYAPEQSFAAVAVVAVIFGMVNLPSVCVWAVMGKEMQRLLTNPARRRAFNGVMAVLLVGSLAMVLTL